MRILFTTQPGDGHFNPLVPIAKALKSAGHDVVVACSRSFCPRVETTGLRAVPSGIDWLASEFARGFPTIATIPPGPARTDWAFADVFAGATATAMLSDLLPFARAWRPDVIVREMVEYGGYLAAEALGLPHATVEVGAFSMTANRLPLIRDPLAAARTTLGLPADRALDTLYRYLHLSCVPPSFQDPGVPLPPTTRALRPVPFDQTGDEALPDWVPNLPEQPTVYATLGTAYNRTPGVFAAILEALQAEAVNVIATIGRDGDAAALGPQPPHVRVERYVPQSLLLPYCDLVITHGGFNTVMASLTHGVPMVVIPISADQPDNARRCVALGVGLAIAPEDRRPSTIANAVRAVLAEPMYRANARRIQAEINLLPGPEEAVALLEALVGGHQPRASGQRGASPPRMSPDWPVADDGA